ncbi:MAG: hypothetical protein EPN97_04410 [Alphaproteobacteria bacterium]|nr:MAG: hypothetical protein EPN97_04410 [Alphaproteobacteria bacterium]
MKDAFNAAACSTAEAEDFLACHSYSFQRQGDGRLLVQGNIDIANRQLAELPDLSCVIVTGNFYCQDNQLTSLKGAPSEVRGGFWCNGNRLESLEYSPNGITGQYICSNNRLSTLAHAPENITGDFACAGNPLTSLEGAPKQFNKLMSDFGTFKSWEEVPEKFRYSEETLAEAARKSVVLQENMSILKPITFKKATP